MPFSTSARGQASRNRAISSQVTPVTMLRCTKPAISASEAFSPTYFRMFGKVGCPLVSISSAQKGARAMSRKVRGR